MTLPHFSVSTTGIGWVRIEPDGAYEGADMENLKIIKRPEVEAITGLSRSSIYAKIDDGTFPKAIKLSERSVGWLEHEVQEWLKNRISATRQGGVQ